MSKNMDFICILVLAFIVGWIAADADTRLYRLEAAVGLEVTPCRLEAR